MDWLWSLYRGHVERELSRRGLPGNDQRIVMVEFIGALGESTATLYVMEPVAGTIRFKGLGQWRLNEVPGLVADPNAFIADRFGGGKFKVNFHRGPTFVGTHNFRTHGPELWRQAPEVTFD
jgi:hypothetical protein